MNAFDDENENEGNVDKHEDEDEEEEEEEDVDVDKMRTVSVKEISAPYSVPHYPIEVEEHRNKNLALEERASHLGEDQCISHLFFILF
jgi:hypothetical protein